MNRNRGIKLILICVLVVTGVLLVTSGNIYADLAFGTPENLGPTINTVFAEGTPCISSDGLTLYFGDTPWNPAPGGYGGVDIWIATRPALDQPWDSVINAGATLNTSYLDGTPNISTDGLSLFFASDRPGGRGDMDLWISTRPSLDVDWSEPENLGSVVNSNQVDAMPCISSDGLTLYFYSSERPSGLGSGDLWVSRRSSPAEPWGAPENLGPNVNSSKDDGWPCLLSDGLTLIFNSNRAVSPEDYDLYISRRTSIEDPWQQALNLGPSVNSPYNDGAPSVSADGQWLYFHSERPGPGGHGDLDLWQARIEPLVDFDGDGDVDCTEICIMIEFWGTDELLCDIAPPPFGDGVVDVQDLILLCEHLTSAAEDPNTVIDPTL